MTLSIRHEETGKVLKFGRLKRGADAPEPISIPAADLLKRSFAAADSLAFPSLAQACFDRMLMNDKRSCCTCVTAMKCAAAILGDAGVQTIFDNAQSDDLYRGACGWDGTDATDQGGIPDNVIDYVTKNGIERNLHHYAGKVLVDGSNPDEIRRVLKVTKNLYCAADLPPEWTQAANGSVLAYGSGPNPEYGHAFPAGGRKGYYTDEGLVLTLWGGIECLCPWPVLTRVLSKAEDGEAHSMVSRDMLRAGLQTTSEGFDWGQYSERFTALGGTLA